MSSFSVTILWHTYAQTHPKRKVKIDSSLTKNSYLAEDGPFEVKFKRSRLIICQFFVDISKILGNCVLFQFLTRGIRIQSPIRTGDRNGSISNWMVIFGKKYPLLKLNLQGEGQLYGNCLVYYFDYWGKIPSFLALHIRIYNPTRTDGQMGSISRWKRMKRWAENDWFWSLTL